MEKKTKTQEPIDGVPADVPAWLIRSQVYKCLPIHVRQRLDAALLSRTSDAALETIAAQFKLSTYGISLVLLKKYTKKLEQWIRPSLAAQVLAGVLGCLPESYRRQLVAGSEVLLLSRIVRALSSGGENELPIGDVAKLASVLTAFGRSTAKRAARKTHFKRGPRGSEPHPEPSLEGAGLAQAVRRLYGLQWPPQPTV